MATIKEMVAAGMTRRTSGPQTGSSTTATAQNTPILKANPRRVSWVIANSGANAGRIARRPGIVSDTVGIPLAANDGLVSEDFETAGRAVQDAVYLKMATGDQTVYVEEVELDS